MSVLGIDVGAQNSVLATVGKGAVSIVRNEISERLTPSLVGFTATERLIGEGAYTQLKSNYSNTCRGMKNLLGRSRSDPDISIEQTHGLADLEATPSSAADGQGEGEVGYAVQYKGERKVFAATRVFAALLTKLKETAEKSKGLPVADVVIGAPSWFTDVNRTALLAAARIAGLNCRRILSEYTATALDYGIYRSAEFHETQPTRVAFVSMGHSNASVAVVDFVRASLKVVTEVGDRNLGGRDIDMEMVRKYRDVFRNQTGQDVLKSTKARVKLEEVCRKAKTILSANSEACVNIECLMGEDDLSATIGRQEFEELCAPLAARLEALIARCLAQAGGDASTIKHVEIAGGCTRIPWVQLVISKCFGKEISRTLNMDECVARGCALQAAMCSPLFKVRDFGVWEKNFHPISIAWEGGAEDGAVDGDGETKESPSTNHIPSTGVCVFDYGCCTNASKYITFNKYSTFDIIAKYKNASNLPTGTDPVIGRYTIVLPAGSKKKHTVKAKTKLNFFGLFAVEKALLVEEEEVEETVMERMPKASPPAEPPGDAQTNGETTASDPPVEPPAQTSVDGVDGKPQAATSNSTQEYEEVPVKKLVKRQKRTELPVNAAQMPARLTGSQIQVYHDDELNMSNDDRIQQETKEKMNELEGYIYSMRTALAEGGQLHDYIQTPQRTAFLCQLDDAENWLYDNYKATKSSFVQKLEELQAVGNCAATRRTTLLQVREELQNLDHLAQECRVAAQSPNEQYAHISQEKKSEVVQKANEAVKWAAETSSRIASQELYEDLQIKPAEIIEAKNSLQQFAQKVFAEQQPPPPAQESVPASPTVNNCSDSSDRGGGEGGDERGDGATCGGEKTPGKAAETAEDVTMNEVDKRDREDGRDVLNPPETD